MYHLSAMGTTEPDIARRQKILAAALAALLIAFAIWCVVLLARSRGLRADLDEHLAWLADVRRLEGELEHRRAEQLESPPGAAPPDAGRATSSQALAEIFEQPGDPQLQVAARSLEEALARLGETTDSDAAWAASAAVLAAIPPLSGELQRRVSEILGRLDRHWRSLNLLVLASLLLAGGNLGLLLVAQRRRREIERSHAELERQGSHDPLTGLWNRAAILRLLREELARAQRTGLPLGVIVADLDRFHEVNVLLGQDQGDFILTELAERLGSMVRPYDTLGRLGGDDFLVVLPACDPMATSDVAERLRAAINERDVDHGLGKVRITVSLAHATVGADDDHDPDLLLHRLQESMQAARAEQGPGRIAVL